MSAMNPVDLILSQAVDAYTAGNLDEAQTHFLKILNINEKHPDALYFMAMIDFHGGRTEVAEHRAHDLLLQKPTDGKALSLMGTILMNQGKTDEAVVHFNKGIKYAKEDYVLRVNAAICYIGLGNPDKAIELCKEAIGLKDDYLNAYNILGNAYMGKNDMENAALTFEQALERQPEFHDARFNLGVALYELNRYEEAESNFDQVLVAKPDSAHALCRKADILMVRKIPAEAGPLYDKAISVNPNHAPAYNGRGKVFQILHKHEDAIRNFKRAIELNPQNIDSLLLMGNSFIKLGNLEAAAIAFKDILEGEPTNAQAKFHLAAVEEGAAPAKPDGDYVKQLFDEFADTFDSTLIDIEYNSPEQLFNLAQKYLPTSESGSYDTIDLGCGTGLSGVLFHTISHKLIGIDVSPRMLEIARTRGIYQELEENDILGALVTHQDDIDIAVSADTFPYIGELESIFVAVTSALRKGGLFVFSLETHEGDEEFKLEPTIRYSHSKQYIQDLAARRELEVLACEPTVYRKEEGKEVKGLNVVLRKN